MRPDLRPVGPVDVVSLATLHRRCFHDMAWGAESFATLIDMPGCFGWALEQPDDETRLTAMILARQAVDEAEVLTLCVDPRLRRNGYARCLVRRLIAQLADSGAVSLFLEVAVCNAPALALYRDFGFSEVGRRVNYYEGGTASERVDACMLRLQLMP